MPELIRLVHNNTIGLKKLITTFQAHWGAIQQRKRDTNTSHDSLGHCPTGVNGHVSPQGAVDGEIDSKSLISKRQLEKKIQQIAVKEVRAPSSRPTWYVRDCVLQQYNIDTSQLTPLLPATPMTSRSQAEKSASPETPLSTPVGKKGGKRKATGTTPSVKTLFEAISKSPQNAAIVGNSGQKRLKLTPSPAAVVKTTPAAAVGCRSEPAMSGKPPPKKRICLESLSFKMPSQPNQPPGSVADSSSSGTQSTRGVGVSGDDNIIVLDDDSADSTFIQPTHNSCMDTCTTNETCSTPCSTVHALLSGQKASHQTPPATAGVAPAPTSNTSAKTETKTKYLQEFTNHEMNARGGGGEGGGERAERKQCIDWEKLKNSNTNKITVTAEVH